MIGLSKITDRILDEARAQAKERLDAADAEAERILSDYKAKADAEVSRINAAAKAEAAEIVARAKSAEQSIEKNLVLKLQGEAIDRAFEAAYKELLSLTATEKLELLTGLLAATLAQEWEAEQVRESIYGCDDEVANGSERIYEVILSPKDREQLGRELLDSFKRKIVGKDMGDLPSRVVLSDDTADIEGGLVVRVGMMEINNTYASIISRLRPALENKVAKILFPG